MSAEQVAEGGAASLSALSPAPGSARARTRAGRGVGTGKGKTCGRGHKGQLSRSGGGVPFGFEGGQMPIHRRIPKRGFRSRTEASWLRLPTSALARLEPGEVTLEALKGRGMLGAGQTRVKFYLSGEVKAAFDLSGVAATAGARAAIEAAGGKVAGKSVEGSTPGS